MSRSRYATNWISKPFHTSGAGLGDQQFSPKPLLRPIHSINPSVFPVSRDKYIIEADPFASIGAMALSASSIRSGAYGLLNIASASGIVFANKVWVILHEHMFFYGKSENPLIPQSVNLISPPGRFPNIWLPLHVCIDRGPHHVHSLGYAGPCQARMV